LKVIAFDFFGVLCSDLFEEWIDVNHLDSLRSTLRLKLVNPADVGVTSFEDQCRGLAECVGRNWISVYEELLGLSKLDLPNIDLIERLMASGNGVAICSNAPSGLLDEILRRHSVDLPWRCKVVSGEVGVAKPSPKIFDLLAESAGVDLHNCILIDDRETNVHAARRAGMQAIEFHTSAGLAEELLAQGII